MRVLAALSGGVDSAVAAARALDAGHDVTAVHLALAGSNGGHGCCTPEDARDARRAADVLDLPFYVWDFAARFRAEVIDDFVAEYAAGRTPNPCLRCNERIKFAAVLDRARALGFDAVCTGHYARLDSGVLYRGCDPAKDQSYVLGTLFPRQLAGALFPVGDSLKSQIRAEAAVRGLLVADKPDSYDVCFVPPGGVGRWLRSRVDDGPGSVVDTSGAVVGSHEGASGFTVGQRRGLGLSTPAADGRPRYVLSVSPVERTVVVGPESALDVEMLTAARWSGAPFVGEIACAGQVRAHGAAVSCQARLDDGVLCVSFESPVRGVASGQAVVLYDGDRVLGGATIDATDANFR